MKSKEANVLRLATKVVIVWVLLVHIHGTFGGELVLSAVTPPGTPAPSNWGPVLAFDIPDAGPLIGKPGIPSDQVSDPDGLAFSPQGELFVGNRHGNNGDGSVARFLLQPDGGLVPNGKIYHPGLSRVHQITFGPNGDLFCLNLGGSICRFAFDVNGDVTNHSDACLETGLSNTIGIACSESGELFVSNAGNVVYRFLFDDGTTSLQANGSFTIPQAVGIHFLKIDSFGDLYLAALSSAKVVTCDLASTPPICTDKVTGVPGVHDVAFSSAGELLVAAHRDSPGISRFLFDEFGVAIPNGFMSTPSLGGIVVRSLVREILIDIKPGSDPNSINLGSHGVVPVAILTTSDFDATTVDPDTVELAGSSVAIRGNGSRLLATEEDVDDDGDIDLVLQVETENLTLETGTTEAILTGLTYNGENIIGADTIVIVNE